jgi:hypothetical protein
MGPKKTNQQSGELFRQTLREQINLKHPLVRLADLMNWQGIETVCTAECTSGLGRNWLKGAIGDAIHAVLGGAGHNYPAVAAPLAAFLRLLTLSESAPQAGAAAVFAVHYQHRLFDLSQKTDLFRTD